LVFDLGQVIVCVNEERTATAIAGVAGISPQQVLERVKNDELRVDFQEGRLTAEQWHSRISDRMGLQVSFSEFCDAWNSMLDRETILNEEFFSRLSRHYRLLALSNTDPIHVEWMEANLNVLRHIPVRIYSCFVGTRKPKPSIYEMTIQKAGVGPGHIFYVDDSPENVEAGRRAGFQAYLFQDAEALQNKLQSRGILF